MSSLILWSRRLVKTVVAGAVGPLLPPSAPLVIGYHRVVEDFEGATQTMMPSMLVSRAMFERQLDCLARHYEFVSVEEFGARLDGRRARGKPIAAVTFDDGYQDVYDHAFPILKRKGLPGAVFVVTDLVGTGRPLLNDRVYWLLTRLLPVWTSPAAEIAARVTRVGVPLAEAQRIGRYADTPTSLTRALLTHLTHADLARVADVLGADLDEALPMPPGALPVSWAQLREMRAAGMTIGSHTQRHIRLTNEDRDLQKRETIESRRHLERELGGSVSHFAYPDGDFNSASVRLVAAAGYRWAYTTCRHRDPYYSRLTTPRLMLWEHSSIDVSGRLSPSILRCQSGGVLGGPTTCSYVAHA